MNRDEILKMIDNIDSVKNDSEIHVIESMINLIDKTFMISEYYEGDDISTFAVFQESDSILDKVKKESKKDDNKFITILMFLPRLIKALINSIKIPKDSKKAIEKFKKNAEKLNGLSTHEKEIKVKELNKKFNGEAECYLDEKSGKIKFKKDKGKFLIKLTMHSALILSTYNLFKRIRAELDIFEPSNIRTFIDDCDKVIHGDKSISKVNLFNGGLSALSDLMKDFFAISGEVTIIGTEICTKLDDMIKKDMIKDVPNEKKQQIMQNINALSSRITKINAEVAAAVGSMGVLLDWGELLGNIFGAAEEKNKEMDEIRDQIEAANPKHENESEQDYRRRMLHLIENEAKRRKQEKKQEIKNAKQQIKDERASRRNGNDKS